jgi:hypothetical protein
LSARVLISVEEGVDKSVREEGGGEDDGYAL